jgi:hypothetical protein
VIRTVDNTAFLVIKKSLFNTKEGIRRGLLDVAPEIQREVRRLIFSPPKTGRLYVIGGKVHQASAPGEAPANLTGDLAQGVGYEVSSHTRLVIGDRAEHGKWLEGNEPSRIAPRPHLRPAALSKAREVGQAIVRGVARELGKVIR